MGRNVGATESRAVVQKKRVKAGKESELKPNFSPEKESSRYEF